MRSLFFSIFIIVLSCLGCRKEDDYYVDPRNPLEFSEDSISFDTVFTTTGSTYRRVKVFNRSNKKIKISEIKLMGGESSSYQININGQASSLLTDFELRGRDSINMFIKVTINPNAENQPFIVTDSVQFITEGNIQQLHLRAFGQNAHFVKDLVIDENTVWDNSLPYVVYNFVKVNEGKTLIIPKGSRIYFHKGGKLEVAGTLRIEGEADDSVTIASDRLERLPYAEEKGQWDGIRFLESSRDNFINHATIKNALIGLQTGTSSATSSVNLFIANSIVKNMEIAGITGYKSSITAFNNLFANCGRYLIYCPNGGNFNFKQNTFVNLSSRTTPSLYFSDILSESTTGPLQVTLINNIIWGALQDELIVEKKGNDFSQTIRSNLIKSTDRNIASFGNIVNENPSFVANSITYYLMPGSTAENKGEDLSSDPNFLLWLSSDKNNKTRIFPSELGCYEIIQN
ncbi:hypothetical protein [Desertivirga xinjiangensis]|uniref:hypothetical protein n=1 Tax=Desertivirga xinjiangensis TaxID=539206 RepID=UPI00210B7C3E|nr:hypothetical protein [Pedobacter xinjiangensis]